MKFLILIGGTIAIAIAGVMAIWALFRLIMIGDLVIFKVVLWIGTPIMGVAYFINWFKYYSDLINGKVKRYQSKYFTRWPLAFSYTSIGPLGTIFVLVHQRLKGVLIGEQHMNVILFLIMIVIAVMMIIDSEWFARLIDTICGKVELIFNVFLYSSSTDTSPSTATATSSTFTDTSTDTSTDTVTSTSTTTTTTNRDRVDQRVIIRS